MMPSKSRSNRCDERTDPHLSVRRGNSGSRGNHRCKIAAISIRHTAARQSIGKDAGCLRARDSARTEKDVGRQEIERLEARLHMTEHAAQLRQ